MDPTFPVKAARVREDGAVEVEFDVPKGHPVAEAARAGALHGLSIGDGTVDPVVQPRRSADGATIRSKAPVPPPRRDGIRLPEEFTAKLPPPAERVYMNRADRRGGQRKRGRRRG